MSDVDESVVDRVRQRTARTIEPDRPRCRECALPLQGDPIMCPRCGDSSPLLGPEDHEIVIRNVNDPTWAVLVDVLTDAGIKRGCIRRE